MNASIPREAKRRTTVKHEIDVCPLPLEPAQGKLDNMHALWKLILGGEAAPQPDPQANRSDARGMVFIDSFNWSGATVTAKQSQIFSQIWGTWRAPAFIPPSGEDAILNEGIYECSVWIGIDGQRRYLNSTLPQVGSTLHIEVDRDGKVVKNETSCWTQWWARDDCDTGPVPVPKFDVNPGDWISAVLSVQADRKSVICHIINNTTPASVQINIAAPPLLGTDQRQYLISGATAEWIVERPAVTNDGAGPPAAPPSLLNFPNFETVEFTECFALAEGEAVVKPEHSLLNATYHRLYEIVDRPQRTQFLAKPRRGDATGFSVVYSGPI